MFSRIFIERPRFAMVISIVLTACRRNRRLFAPITLYPGNYPARPSGFRPPIPAPAPRLSPTRWGIPLEETINGVEDMLYMDSSSDATGSYGLTITFKVGTDPDMAQVKVQNRVSQALSKRRRKFSSRAYRQPPLFRPAGLFDRPFAQRHS